MNRPEILRQSQLIGTGINSWLHSEYVASNENYLDGQRALDCLSLPFDDPDNLFVNKWISHHNRQALWVRALRETPDEVNHARILYNVMMATSGGFKRIAAVQSKDQEDYFRIKNDPHSTGTGVNTVKVVRESIEAMVGFDAHDNTDHIAIALQDIDDAFVFAGGVFESLASGLAKEDRGKQTSGSVRLLQESQKRWLSAASSWIAACADTFGGDITEVPYLSPISITKQPLDAKFSPIPIYPFANPD